MWLNYIIVWLNMVVTLYWMTWWRDNGILMHIYEGLYDGIFKYGMNTWHNMMAFSTEYEYKTLCITFLMSCIHIIQTIW
jgi:hypothetical protein